MSNPLLALADLVPFSALEPAHAEPAVRAVIEENRERLEAVLAQPERTWEVVVAPLEAMDDRLERVFAPVSHLHSVMDSPGWRSAYDACLPQLSDYGTELGQRTELQQAFQAVADAPTFADCTPVQRRVVENALRDFRLGGVDLPPAEKARFKTIMQRLSELGSKFQQQLLDATQAWHKHVPDVDALRGVPESGLELLAQAAKQRELPGYLITLEQPSYLTVMLHAEDRALRQEVYEAYVTRASELGPQAGQFDNQPVMAEILALRHEAARLIGFANYAEESLFSKMAPDVAGVEAFLRELAQRARPAAAREFAELTEFAKQRDGLTSLAAWDVGFYGERLREARYELSEEALRPYFPIDRVLQGMFELVGQLYGLRVEAMTGVDVWHPDVRVFRIRSEDGEVRGVFYTDLFARTGKRGGAWMADLAGRRRLPETGEIQVPVATLTCNFTPPVGERPALLTHDEVLTLFHEFGHGLHHMLTRVEHLAVSGINGVEWDAVELPSQFMENWCWQRAVIDMISGHVDSGERLPQALFERLLATRTFQAGMHTVRQLEFALFDLRLHRDFDPAKGPRIYETLAAVRDEVSVVPVPAWNRFPNSFGHIFGGGYAAGYYSYKWAEVLSADAFAAFEEVGIFDPQTGRRFLESVLEQGGSKDALALFMEFRGREPQIDALLRHHGLSAV